VFTLVLPLHILKSHGIFHAALASPSFPSLARQRLSAQADLDRTGGAAGLSDAGLDAAVPQELTQRGPDWPLLERTARGATCLSTPRSRCCLMPAERCRHVPSASTRGRWQRACFWCSLRQGPDLSVLARERAARPVGKRNT